MYDYVLGKQLDTQLTQWLQKAGAPHKKSARAIIAP